MKTHFFFVLAFLCLYFSIGSQKILVAQTNSKDIMEQPITLLVKNKTLKNILYDLSQKYNIRFSYSNSRLPLQKKITLNVSNLPLKDVLIQIFEPLNDKNTQIQFRLINGQIVIQVKSNKAEIRKEKTPILSLPEKPLVINKKDETSKTASVSTKKEAVKENKVELIENKEIIDSLKNSKIDSLELLEEKEVSNKEKQLLDSAQIVKNNAIQNKEILIISKLDSIPLQVSLIYPIGTNGIRSPYKSNRFSFNIFAGYNGSVKGFEMGGLANILKKDIKGFQVAGLTNVVGGKTTGFQVAGFANITKDSVFAFQTAGFMNINGNTTKGFQGAGFLNVINGDFTGFQGAGCMNIVKGTTKGTQVAGFANITKENIDGGTQISGFLNVAKNVKGVQIGIINRADTVKGSQIGLINIADSITGIPIGLINLVKNGYRSFDISASEGFHTAFSYNIGVNKFYQIISAGIQIDNKMRWGLGAGIGTRFPITKNKKTHAGFELMAYHINEKRWTNQLNLLSQLKFKVHYQINKQIGIFVAPTFNITISQIRNNERNTYGTGFAPYNFIKDNTTTFNGSSTRVTNTKIWGGGFIGISF